MEILIIIICAIGITYIARQNFIANRNAGNGWQYLYWQPWRRWIIGLTVLFLVLLTVALVLLGQFGTQPVNL